MDYREKIEQIKNSCENRIFFHKSTALLLPRARFYQNRQKNTRYSIIYHKIPQSVVFLLVEKIDEITVFFVKNVEFSKC